MAITRTPNPTQETTASNTSRSDLGNGYFFYISLDRLAWGMVEIERHRSEGCCQIPRGNDENIVIQSQASFMFSVDVEGRA